MSEIKSTLDLVMERTRHMTLSAEEKARQKKADFDKRLQGLLLQYAEGAFSADALRDRIARLQEAFKVDDRRIVVDTIFRQIDPDGENDRWLALVADIAPAAHDALQQALTAYRDGRTGLQQERARRVLARLDRDHHIRGPAVVPNPDKDKRYRKELDALRQETRATINAAAGHAL